MTGEMESPPRINALIGLGQVIPYIQAFMLRVFDKPEFQAEYFKSRSLISKLARICFCRPRMSNNPLYSLPMEPYIANLGIATSYQFDLPTDSIPDILMIKEERERRGASEIIAKSLEYHDFNKSRDAILNVMNEGLKLEQDLKDRYGSSLENIE
ncbi:MAG: hypothetical protein ACFFCS_29730 [Candidatus Hodarchaeota archaeon]